MSLEDNVYIPENVALGEAIYGKNLFSLGGTAAIENMFSDINLTKLKLLDIGFGLGGVAYYLAETKQANVSGIEINPWMVEHATRHAPKNIAHLLHFDTYDQSGNLPFSNEIFDLVYSKGVFNHVKEKNSLFFEINRVLKPKGLFVIADWIHLNYEASEFHPLVNETKTTYENVLSQSGFDNINFRDDSQIFLMYVHELLKNLSIQKNFIEKSYGKDVFDTILNYQRQLIDNIEKKDKFAVRIVARKK